MSTNTLVLGLFEYDPTTDANLPFSITDALNNNWDKIDSLVPLLSTIAAPFNPEQSYAVGAYCTYQGNLQRCNTNIPTGEVWNPSHWDAVTIMSQSVNSGQINQPNGVAGLGENGAVPIEQGGTGETTVQGVVDAFGIFLAISAAAAYDPEGSYAVGDYCTHGSGLHKCNTAIPDGEAWNAEHWAETTVAAELARKVDKTPPQEHEISFRSGWSNATKSTYYKTQEGSCVVNCAVYGTGVASYNYIATLPAGFRPNATVCRAAHAFKDGIRGIAEAQIAANGDVSIYSPIEFDYVSFGATFQAQN